MRPADATCSCKRAGYALQTSQLFTVDGTPPTIRVLSFAVAARTASLVFTGVDSSTVSFQCKLSRVASSAVTAATPLVPSDPPVVLGQYQLCASPVVSSGPTGLHLLRSNCALGRNSVKPCLLLHCLHVPRPMTVWCQDTSFGLASCRRCTALYRTETTRWLSRQQMAQVGM